MTGEIIIPNPPDSSGGSGAASAETAIQRRLTTAFIACAPVNVILLPRTKLLQADHSWRWSAGSPRPTQTVKLNEPTSTPIPTVTADGIVREIVFELIAEWDALLGENDVFTYDDRDWEVVVLKPDNGWERRALVARYG